MTCVTNITTNNAIKKYLDNISEEKKNSLYTTFYDSHTKYFSDINNKNVLFNKIETIMNDVLMVTALKFSNRTSNKNELFKELKNNYYELKKILDNSSLDFRIIFAGTDYYLKSIYLEIVCEYDNEERLLECLEDNCANNYITFYLFIIPG